MLHIVRFMVPIRHITSIFLKRYVETFLQKLENCNCVYPDGDLDSVNPSSVIFPIFSFRKNLLKVAVNIWLTVTFQREHKERSSRADYHLVERVPCKKNPWIPDLDRYNHCKNPNKDLFEAASTLIRGGIFESEIPSQMPNYISCTCCVAGGHARWMRAWPFGIVPPIPILPPLDRSILQRVLLIPPIKFIQNFIRPWVMHRNFWDPINP